MAARTERDLMGVTRASEFRSNARIHLAAREKSDGLWSYCGFPIVEVTSTRGRRLCQACIRTRLLRDLRTPTPKASST